MSVGAADTSGERYRAGTSLAPVTTARSERRWDRPDTIRPQDVILPHITDENRSHGRQSGTYPKFPINAPRSIAWPVVSGLWLLESVRATSGATAHWCKNRHSRGTSFARLYRAS